MKLGLITDIHEQVDLLRTALDRFRHEQVDQVVVIGDVFEIGERIEETCRLLAEAKAIGVWGNHDYGFCSSPSEQIGARFSASAIDFMTSLRPRIEINDCYFAHVEPWLDPEDIANLWFFEGPPDSDQRLQRIFTAVPNRLIFAGHYHKWMLVTPAGVLDWKPQRIRCVDRLPPRTYDCWACPSDRSRWKTFLCTECLPRASGRNNAHESPTHHRRER